MKAIVGATLFITGFIFGPPPWAQPGEVPKARDRLPRYPGGGWRAGAVAPNNSGQVLDFSASGVTLLSWITLSELPGSSTSASDVWGYVSPSGREYAIMGVREGTAFVEVTDPENPVIVGVAFGAVSIWHDMKTTATHAYSVNEGSGGIEIIDLAGLDSGVVSLTKQGFPASIVHAHNIAYNPSSGFAYLVGTNLSGVGLVALDLTDPLFPQVAGAWIGQPVHDVQVVTYTEGPYAGREIAFAAAGGAGLKIIDVTDKSNMFLVGGTVYPNLTFAHQSALSEDRRYLFLNDELDELLLPSVTVTTTYVIDVQDLENPQFVTTFTSGLPSIDHNCAVRGDFLFEANYTSGLRIFRVSDVMDVEQVGYFDTRPEDDGVTFNGAWGVYADLPSGVVLISDIERGLFVLDVSEVAPPPGPPLGVPARQWKKYR